VQFVGSNSQYSGLILQTEMFKYSTNPSLINKHLFTGRVMITGYMEPLSMTNLGLSLQQEGRFDWKYFTHV